MALPSTVAALRPRIDRTAATSRCDRFDKPDAPALGIRRVATQACHDLFGTKDVQDAITATYVWMADQIGHLTLGVVPTILLCWITSLIWSSAEGWQRAIFLIPAAAVIAVWGWKELSDLKETSGRTTGVFPPDSGDVVWNVKTALLYFGIGDLLGVAAFLRPILVPIALVLSLWPALAVWFWWLRRKLAFQQAALPYLYRLANFSSHLDDERVRLVSDIANLADRKINFLAVVFGRDPRPHTHPRLRHLLISGPLGAGKTSLCVGMGTEFAFALGKARYLSATKLVQLLVGGDDAGERSYEDGLVLWNWRACDLLIVDDVDAGVHASAGGSAPRSLHLIDPVTLVEALSDADGRSLLTWLGPKRSAWVVGDTADVPSWQAAIAKLIDVPASEIGLVALSGAIGSPPAA
ncbi:MAG TPA: hypothetical protein VE397_18570 [Stellaceae bacterium]|nr:hypothetical protein [Stellaceae bacterium]